MKPSDIIVTSMSLQQTRVNLSSQVNTHIQEQFKCCECEEKKNDKRPAKKAGGNSAQACCKF